MKARESDSESEEINRLNLLMLCKRNYVNYNLSKALRT